MVFRSEVAAKTMDGYQAITDYFADVRRFYEIVGTRLAAGEHGVSLASVTDDRRLFSSADSYRLPADSARIDPAGPSSCPAYVWFPTWLGAFYTMQGAQASLCGPMAFVWTWIGLDDAFVTPVQIPECWIGVATFDDDRVSLPENVALQTWRFFRVESTYETTVDNWQTGGFQKNDRGCDLSGRWHLRRMGIDKLSSLYEIEKLIVQPLSERFIRQRDKR